VHNGEGHYILRARAGSAKTTTIEMVAPSLGNETLYCAYAKTIEQSLKERLPEGANVRTVYGLGLSMLRKNGFRFAQVNEDKYFNLVCGAVDAIIETGQLLGESVDPRAVVALQDEKPLADINRLVNMMRLTLRSARSTRDVRIVADHFGLDFNPHVYGVLPLLARAVMKIGYQNIGNQDDSEAGYRGKVCGIDYADMIWAPWVLKRMNGHLRIWRYEKVFCDESQDLSPAQLFIVREMCAPTGRLFFVGDDRQAITGFAGSDTKSMDRIKQELDCTELPLSTCYRCPTSHLELARRIVDDIEDGPNAIEGKVETIDEEQLVDLVEASDMVICRTNAPLVGVCLRLIGAGKPARMKGRAFDKMLLSVVKFAERKRPSCCDFREGLQAWEAKELAKLEGRKGDITSKRQAIEDRVACVLTIYDTLPDPTYVELKQAVRSLFMNQVNPIECSSVHGAKGLEADRVFILEPNLMPLPYAKGWRYEQELNVKYVALTRSKRELYFVETKGAARVRKTHAKFNQVIRREVRSMEHEVEVAWGD
jgi:hypothetical protein